MLNGNRILTPYMQVHFNAPMNPLELEMYHQIKNVIGVNPTFYKCMFMVDADTMVHPLSVNRLISAQISYRARMGLSMNL